MAYAIAVSDERPSDGLSRTWVKGWTPWI